MEQANYVLVTFLFKDWDTPPVGFTRQRLILALSKAFSRRGATVICLDRPVCPFISPLKQSGKFIKKLTGRLRLKEIAPNLFLFTPWIFLHEQLALRFRPAQKINRFLIRRQVLRQLKKLGLEYKIRISWIFHPYQRDMVGSLKEDLKVYECYDDYTAPNYTRPEKIPWIRGLEAAVLKSVDMVLTTSKALYEKCRIDNKNTYLVPNGVDFELFSLEGIPSGEMEANFPAELRKIDRPRLGFLGRVNLKIDFDLLEALVTVKPEWNYVFVGPLEPDQDGRLDEQIRRMARFRNIYFLDTKPFESLPYFLNNFDACIIPYVKSDLTHAIYPLKLNEYLAAGKPVISTDFADLSEFKDLITITEGPHGFVNEITTVLTEGEDDLKIERRQEKARENSWTSRAETITEMMERRMK